MNRSFEGVVCSKIHEAADLLRILFPSKRFRKEGTVVAQTARPGCILRRILTASLVFALSASVLPALAQNAAPVLTVQADKSLHPVSPTLYGLMTEEINYSYDGGLYAELVKNRATPAAAILRGRASRTGSWSRTASRRID